MPEQNWDKVWSIFNEAVEKPTEERAAFVEKACAGDEGLRWELESLLAQHDKSRSFLEKAPVSAAPKPVRRRLKQALRETYIIQERIGGGGMGDLYLATHKILGGKWAVKVLADELARDPAIVNRFLTEARIEANLQHPNIVKVFHIGHVGEFHYLVMNYVEGEDLAARMARGPMAEKEVVSIALQICRALACAHDHKIIHRDLKPTNVRIDSYGTVVVLDFGIARARDEAIRSKTALGERLGTPLYMSPEQIRGLRIDRRTDFYSLGVLLYEMLSGTNPFRADSPHAIYLKHLETEPEPLCRVRLSISPHLSDIVARLLRKKAQDRPDRAADIIAQLKSLGLASEISTPEPDSCVSQPRSRLQFFEDDVFQIDKEELEEFEKLFPEKEKHITPTQLFH